MEGFTVRQFPYCFFVLVLVPDLGIDFKAGTMNEEISRIEIDGKSYSALDLTDNARKLLQNLAKLEAFYEEKKNLIAILTKAKKAYMADLKTEMLSAKSGFDFT